jgi:hypothetical protein
LYLYSYPGDHPVLDEVRHDVDLKGARPVDDIRTRIDWRQETRGKPNAVHRGKTDVREDFIILVPQALTSPVSTIHS